LGADKPPSHILSLYKTAVYYAKLAEYSFAFFHITSLLLPLLHPFNGLVSGTTWVSQHQKGKPFWILLERKDGVAVASAGPYANHLHLAPDR